MSAIASTSWKTIHSGIGFRVVAAVLLTSFIWLSAPTVVFADDQAKSAPPDEQLTEADKIARLQRVVDETQAQITRMREALNDPAGEYFTAEREFVALDAQLSDLIREVDRLRASGQEAEVEARTKALDDLRKRWALSRERFQLAIEERRTQSEQIEALEQKLAQDRADLSALQAATTRPVGVPREPRPTPVDTSAVPVPQPAAPDAVVPSAGPLPIAPAQVPTTAPANGAAQPAAAPQQPVVEDEQVRRARERAEERKEEAVRAEVTARSLSERIEAVRKAIDLQQKLQETARKKAANALETQRALNDQVQKRWTEGAPKEELDDLWTKIAEARKRYREAEADVMKGVDHIDELQDELERLQSEHIAALEEAAKKRDEAVAAEKLLKELSDPWHPQNVARWLRDRGLRIAGIALAMAALLWIVRRTQRYMIRVMSGGRGSREELENRAKTLVGVFNNAATIAILIGGALMVLTELGMSIGPLLGGAAVVGLAVGLGAQNLIRDFFSGFMILLENQYGLNDVVRINNMAGLVENITLRITVLRDVDGAVHFIPNGQINAVTNLTHGWSRAVFDIGISYNSDVDRAMSVLIEIGREMRREPAYHELILDDPEMLGVDALAESAVVIRFVMRTRPLKQWMVKREMLRRIKKRFDEVGIEIPFPHRTVYHRYAQAAAPTAADGTEKIERSERFIPSGR